MRVAYVYDAIYPYVAGGAERRCYEIGRRLVARGHDVELIGWQWWSGEARRNEYGMRLRGVGAPHALHDAEGRRTFREALAFATRLAPALATVRADVVECSSIPYLPTFVAEALCRVRPIPLVVCWHEYMGERWQAYAGRRARIAGWVERHSARCGDHRLAVSEFTRRRLPPGPPIRVLGNGVDFGLIAAASRATRTIDVVVAGRLVPHKRVDLLLEAMALLPGGTAEIIGEGPERRRLEQEAQRLGVGDRVKFCGRVANESDVYEALGRARATVVTSEQEGFGISVVEAQAAGTPPIVVRSPHSAAADLVVDGLTGIVAPPNAEAIAEALAQVVHHPDVRRRLGGNAQAAARMLDWDAVTDRAEEFYASVTCGDAGQIPAATRRVAA